MGFFFSLFEAPNGYCVPSPSWPSPLEYAPASRKHYHGSADDQVHFHGAQGYCQDLGMELASIMTLDDYDGLDYFTRSEKKKEGCNH